ncbi:MAG TPA: 2-oxoglutarate dehydrogenase, E2 component, dihydrolipoamide succinyltransferase, partial [Pyrinomonadaceae bacterium]|nr:2-oxoglutarate dehydrogenase, E2 component, dihydrolipoamide succinyltransferase [Pyrinomonadaceae bacterium]
VMPQMGESITEGTISKWHKAVGDKIERDEPLLEISTDKVDAEVPAPSAGVLLEIRHQEGETVEVGTALAIVGEEGESAVSSQQSAVGSQTETTIEEAKPVAEEIKQPEPIEQKQIATATTASESSANSATSESSGNSATPATSENSTEVVMPQMGESITEGTISKWLKKVGDKIERDEPLLEISTDKVDAEVPSPAAGTLLEIRYQEGETVEVGTAVAFVGSENGAGAVQSQKSKAQSQEQAEQSTAQATGADVSSVKQTAQTIASMPVEERKDIKEIEEVEGRSYDYGRDGAVEDAQKSSNGQSTNGKSNGNQTIEDLRKTKSSPLVRNIAKEHGIDISRLAGSGMSGRVTKKDIMSFIESGAALKPQDLLRKGAPTAPMFVPTPQPQTASQPAQKVYNASSQTSASVGDKVEPMSVMRKKIAEHMTFSKQTSAHVTSVYEIDMTSVAKFREKNKLEFQSRYGTKLSFMPFIFQATTNALRKFPVVNSQVSGEQIVYKGDVNLGMAVALDWGLIVPVIKKADTLSLTGLALAANDLADRARTKKLMPDEVQGGTFTITNPGVFGGLFGTPIINQPQVAILCVGTIEKRPKVLTTPDGDDYIAIRSMAYFALTYDHRIVDGADAEKFLSFMKEYLETTQFAL